MSLCRLILAQTVGLAFRKGGGAFGLCGFYIIIVTLFTFALGPEAMAEQAAAVMCVALLLASVAGLPLFYERDHEDGTLEQLLLQPVVLEWLVLAKIAGQWVSSVLPMLLVSPLLAVMADLDAERMLRVMGLLLLASPSIVALGSIAAALTIGSRRGGLLQALVAMPLYVPVLIFAASAGEQGAMPLLAGMLCGFLPLSCVASAALIRISQD